MENLLVGWIGSKIKALRNQKNQSLKELSDRSKISKGLLSKIENNRTIPSLPVFLNILQSLNISPKDFFDDMYLNGDKNYLLIKESERTEIEKEDRPGLIYQSILNQPLMNLSIEIVHLTIQPEFKYAPTSTDGYEFKLVLSGEVDYTIGQDTVSLSAGDSIFFDARTLHYPISRNVETRMLVIYFLF